ncbi:uncharacterized protein LOC114280063 isoform X2 [Camellia sinensis]|uniref:uncharacterized protein LOC114280063 isoform X2 n=1 Tax=Camellia sinensis TaxID=4442 RepID=UPI001036F2BD|nr:uncharacterized protein LOC114280063 isoform X2 [Camellia sinensis]
MWASILIQRELFIGTLNPRAYKCISEAYCPSQCARQFGLIQGIPVPLCSLSNSDLATRELKVPKTRLNEATFKLITDLDEFEFFPFIPQGVALKRYQNWWIANMEVHLVMYPKDLLKGLDVPSVKPKETGITIASIIAPAASSPPLRVTRAISKKAAGTSQEESPKRTQALDILKGKQQQQRKRKRKRKLLLDFEEEAPKAHSEKEEEGKEEAPLKRKKKTFSPSELIRNPTHAKAVEKEQSKEIIIFQRSEKRRQQQIQKEEAVAPEARKKQTARSKTVDHYALCSSPIITTTTTEVAASLPLPTSTLPSSTLSGNEGPFLTSSELKVTLKGKGKANLGVPMSVESLQLMLPLSGSTLPMPSSLFSLRPSIPSSLSPGSFNPLNLPLILIALPLQTSPRVLATPLSPETLRELQLLLLL